MGHRLVAIVTGDDLKLISAGRHGDHPHQRNPEVDELRHIGCDHDHSVLYLIPGLTRRPRVHARYDDKASGLLILVRMARSRKGWR